MTKCRITPALTKKAARLIREGFTYRQLAAALGISEDTLYSWFRKARNDKTEPYLSFSSAIEAAEEELLSELLQAIRASIKSGDARSAYFLLERRFASEYGKSSQLNVNQKSESVNLNLSAPLSLEDADALRAEILSRLTPKSLPPRINVTEG